MDTNSIFVHDEGDFYPSHVFNIGTSKQNKLFIDTYDMFSIKSSDTAADKLVILRESDVHLNGNSEVFYVVETYLVQSQEENKISETYQMKEQSLVLGESQIGVCVMVQLSCDKVLLLSIKKEDHAMQAVVNIFTSDKEKLVQSGHLFCALPENAFSEKVSLLNRKYFITCRPGRRFVDIWDLNKVEESTNKAEMIWEKEIVKTKSIPMTKCSALDFCFPHLFVGKSNGCCDIWNIISDNVVRTLEHGLETGLHMGIKKICILSNYIFSLSDSGWLFAWDKKESLKQKQRKEKEKDFLLWTNKSKGGKTIGNFVVDNTKMVTIEQHQNKSVWQSKIFLVVRNFWNHVEKNNKKKKNKLSQCSLKRKTESGNIKRAKRMKSASTSKTRTSKLNDVEVIDINDVEVIQIEDSSDEGT